MCSSDLSLSSAVFVDNEARKIIETPYFKTLILSASKVQELDLSEIDSFVLLSVVEGRLNVNHPSGKKQETKSSWRRQRLC